MIISLVDNEKGELLK